MHNHHKAGFSLVLFLVYILIFSLISCGICHMIVAIVLPSLHQRRQYQSLLLLESALDLFIRDIRMNRKNQWKILEQHKIAWNDGQKDIEWHYDDKKIERIEGIYEHKWKKKYTSIIATNLAKASFSYHHNDGRLSGITITVIQAGGYKEPVTHYVAVLPKNHD